jgi:hypothetical protein
MCPDAGQPLAAQVGRSFYISTASSDKNPGTMSLPWLTIQHAANTVSAGARVDVFGGVYNEAVNFPKSGTNGTEWPGPNNTGTAARGKFPCYGRYVTVRNNIF